MTQYELLKVMENEKDLVTSAYLAELTGQKQNRIAYKLGKLTQYGFVEKIWYDHRPYYRVKKEAKNESRNIR